MRSPADQPAVGRNVDVSVVRGPGGLAFVTVRAAPAGGAYSLAPEVAYRALRDALGQNGLRILQERVFGSCAVAEAVLQARTAVLGADLDDGGPVTFVDGEPAWGGELAGIQVLACPAAGAGRIEVLRQRGQSIGRAWLRPTHDLLCFSNLRPESHAGTAPRAQAAAVIRFAERCLQERGVSFRQVVRTWFFLDTISAWYRTFNEARNTAYREYGLLDGPAGVWLPASTGIEGSNPSGAACVLDLIAVRIHDPQRVRVRMLRNPQQGDPFEYGSAFSRGVCLDEPEGRHVFISGTAAIDRAGRTAHLGDPRGQIEMTLAHVEALLGQAELTPRQIAHATLFFKHPEHRHHFAPVSREHGWPELPAIFVEASVCRPELLFELDGSPMTSQRSTFPSRWSSWTRPKRSRFRNFAVFRNERNAK